MSLVDALSYQNPTGIVDYSEVVRFVRERYLGVQDFMTDGQPINAGTSAKDRRRHMGQRVSLYRDKSREEIAKVIDAVFEHKDVREQRKKLIEYCRGMNVTRRVVDEVASVYDRPARRTVKPSDQEVFEKIERETQLHGVHKTIHRMLRLCNEVLVWSDIGQVSKRQRLDVITPDAFDVIEDPREHLTPAGFLIDWKPKTWLRGDQRRGLTHWLLVDDTVVIKLDGHGKMIGVPETHNIGRIPAVLLHRTLATEELLDEHTGGDIISAHLAVLLLNVLVLRLAKSQGERQPVLKGDLARVAANQPFDGEHPVGLPPDTDLAMLDMKTHPDHYILTIKHTIGQIAATYGMSYEQFTFTETADTASGKAYSVRRAKLRELRSEGALAAHDHEREVAELYAAVARAKGMPWFDPAFLVVAHAEAALPTDQVEELDILERRIALGIDDVLSHLVRERRISEEAALVELRHHLDNQANQERLKRAYLGAQPVTDGGDERVADTASPEAPPALDTGEAASTEVQQTALNGAQVDAMVGIARSVAMGEVRPEQAVAILEAAFPITREQAVRIAGRLLPGAEAPESSPNAAG